jgi:hypothetical protein
MTVIEAPLSSPLTTPLWNSTFDAGMNVRYWGYVGRAFSARKVHQNISCGILHHECRRQSGQSGPTMPKHPCGDRDCPSHGELFWTGGEDGRPKREWTRLLSQPEPVWAKNERDAQLDIESEFSRIQERSRKRPKMTLTD